MHVQVAPMLVAACDAHCTAPPSAPAAPTAGGGTEADKPDTPTPLPLTESVQCLVAAYCSRDGEGEAMAVEGAEGAAGTAAACAQGAQLVAVLLRMLQANLPWQQHLTVVQACTSVLKARQTGRGHGLAREHFDAHESGGERAG